MERASIKSVNSATLGPFSKYKRCDGYELPALQIAKSSNQVKVWLTCSLKFQVRVVRQQVQVQSNIIVNSYRRSVY